MLDADLIAIAIGLIQTKTSVTSLEVANELEVSQEKAIDLLLQLEQCNLIVHFDGFFASTDLAELN